MQRTILAIAVLLLLATACPKTDNTAPGGTSASAPPPGAPPDAAPGDSPHAMPDSGNKEQELIARGQELFTDYVVTKTGLTCANCHSISPMMDEGKIYIARNAYTMTRRGIWRANSEEQIASGMGEAASLGGAITMCVTAPYYNNTAGLPADDLAALTAFINTLDKPELEAAPIISKASYPMPAAGLTPDREHGKEIYETSCKFCHDNAVRGIESLAGAKDWLTPIQVMAKVRKAEGDWYNDYKGQAYACIDPLARQLALLGINVAHAQELDNPHGIVNPHGDPDGAAAEPAMDESELFPMNAMPGYAPEILSDQDVVDVAFYVAEEL